MNLAAPPPAYDRADQSKLREALRRADAESLKRGRDIEVASGRLILTAPDGGRWALSVSNAGAAVFTAL